MEELLEKYEEYKDYLNENGKDFDEYLNLRDFMFWLNNTYVSHN